MKEKKKSLKNIKMKRKNYLYLKGIYLKTFKKKKILF